MILVIMDKLFFAIIFMFSTQCWAASPLNNMSLEEKIGQLLMVHFNGEEVNEEAKTLIQDLHVGSIIYYNWANGLHSPEQVCQLSSGIQKLAEQNRMGIPLLIAIDQEGGLVARLTRGFTIFPGNKALGMSGDTMLAEQSCTAIGKELRAVGINMNLSPVTDINNNQKNPVIGIRSFGETPEIVLSFAKKALQGYRQAAVISTLKHFPGHGDVELDSHADLPFLNKSTQQLKEFELLPFAELAKEADAVMTAHIIVPAWDSKNCATLSKKCLDVLRNDLGFEGVILTDSLVMEGLLKNCASIDDAAIRALDAGCDLLILGGKQLTGAHASLELTITDVKRIHEALTNAVKTERISEERLNQAVDRVLKLKQKYKLTGQGDPASVNAVENRTLAAKIAALSLRAFKNSSAHFPSIRESNIVIYAPEIIQESMNQTAIMKIGKTVHSHFFKTLNPSENEMQNAIVQAEKADLLIFFSYNAWKNSAQSALIHSLLNQERPLILIALRDPLDAALFPKSPLIINTFSPTAPSIQAVCDYLHDELGAN